MLVSHPGQEPHRPRLFRPGHKFHIWQPVWCGAGRDCPTDISHNSCLLPPLYCGVASKRKYFNFLAWRDFDTICLHYLHSPALVSSSGRGSHEIKLIPLQSREAGRGRGEGRHCKRGRKTITKFVIFSFHKFINCVPTFESLMKCYNLGRRGG